MQKMFDKWNENKKMIQEKDPQLFAHVRDIWWCSIGVNIGSEIDGKNESFLRPVLLIRKFRLDTFWVIPLSSKIHEGPEYVPISFHGKTSIAILSQLKLMSTRRFLRRMARIDEELLLKIKTQIISLL